MLVKKCRVCGGKKFKKVFSLGNQPLANNLLGYKRKTKVYPLELIQCLHCTLLQLSYVAPKSILYRHYLYIPSASKTHLKHFEELARALTLDCQLKKNDLVVDIGSSDGSLLKCFKTKVVGVEPALNIKSSVPTIRKFFNPKTANEIVGEYGKAKLVTATNSFAHINNLKEYLKALDILLDKNGIFFAQFPDVRNLLKENQFDTIYHEHLSYFTYEPLHHLFANSPFELFRVDESEIHGGSMRIYVRRRPKLLGDFKKNIEGIKGDLREFLRGQHGEGKKIVAFGAAAKGMVLLNYCGLNNKIIDYIADGTPYKQGKFAPGVNIPIVSEERIKEDKPDIILILAWNFKEEIINKLGKDFTYIIPIPNVEII